MATVAGTGDVSLMAGHDIAIETAQNTVTESHSSHTEKFGLLGTGGIGFSIGTQIRENTADIDEQFHTGSLVGSTEGRVDIVAGGDVAIAGSDVLLKSESASPAKTWSSPRSRTAVSGRAQKFPQAGLNVSLKGGVVDTAMAVYGAAKRSDEVEDDRLKGLYAAQAGQTLFSGGQAGLNTQKLPGTPRHFVEIAACSGEPLTMAFSFYRESYSGGYAGATGPRRSSSHCYVAHSFVPEKDERYEVVAGRSGSRCSIDVARLVPDTASGIWQRVPVPSHPAPGCSSASSTQAGGTAASTDGSD